MVHNIVEKRNVDGVYYCLISSSKKILIKSSSLEKFVKQIKNLERKRLLPEGFYTGLPSLDKESTYLNFKEHKKFWAFYDSA